MSGNTTLQLSHHSLIRRFASEHTREFTVVLSRFSVIEIKPLLDALPIRERVTVITTLPQNLVRAYLESKSDERIAQLVGETDIDDSVRLLKRMPPDRWRSVLVHIQDLARRKTLSQILLLPDGTAGSAADKDFQWVRGKTPVNEALREIAQYTETADLVLVIDDQDRVLGFAHVVQMLRVPGNTPTGDCVKRVHLLPATVPLHGLIHHPAWFDTSRLPVVNREGRAIGILSRQQIVRIDNYEQSENRPDMHIALESLSALFSVLKQLPRIFQDVKR